MPESRIGFYVHHHGRGHATRTREIIKHLRGAAYVFGSDLSVLEDIQNSRVVLQQLALDTDDSIATTEDWSSVLHYAPTNIPSTRQRAHTLCRCFAEYDLDLLVVDVSVEIALLARLCGVPTIYSRQHGYRWDLAHQAAFENAVSLLAPYPRSWEEPETPNWIQEKTFYAGGFSRFNEQMFTRFEARKLADMDDHQQNVVVMVGFGGEGSEYTKLEETVRQTPHWQWWVMGPVPKLSNPPQNVQFLGVQKNPYPYLKGADIVVASAGNNTVTELAQIKARYICIPEARPFDEQLSKARILARKNAALVLPRWSEPEVWQDHLGQVFSTDVEALHSIVHSDAAQQAAAHIEEVARNPRSFTLAKPTYS